MSHASRRGSGRRRSSQRRSARIACAGLLAFAAAAQAVDVSGQSEAEALLQAGRAAEAAVLFERMLEAEPGSVAAHLGLGRAYYALGEYAQARIEFETVFGFDNLPPDLHGQAEVYDSAAADHATGQRWRRFYYSETGIGTYRENSSRSTELFGGAGVFDTFLPIRVGGGWNADMTERDTFSATLDYRFRAYDSDRRNDSDLRWNFNAGRTIRDDNLRFGMRGRLSYRGNGQYRNEWGAFADYRRALRNGDQVTLAAEVGERRYPRGPLRIRSREITSFSGSWTRALANGRTALTLGGHLTHEWATQGRVDGDGTSWGVSGEADHSFSDTLDGFLSASYASETYDGGRADFSATVDLSRVRNDDLWNFGGGLAWRFGSGWTLRPTLEYNWEESNIAAFAYSSTELWVTVRKSF
jgi:hypothetical protein